MQINTKWIAASCATLVLCACNTPMPTLPTAKAPAAQPTAVHKDEKPVERGVESTFKEQLVIKPRESIEKGQLLVSYSIKAVPDDANALVLSLTFRNLKNRQVRLVPRITLSDNEGKTIAAYSRQEFILQAKRPATGDQTVLRAQAEKKIKWANSFWLQDRFTIPANGIEVGERVFYCKTACQPKQLSVLLGKLEFPFEISPGSR